MKKKTLSFMLLSAISFLNFSYGQNLVPNWSFEDTINCPTGPGQIHLANGWDSFRGTPDYFNSCAGGNGYTGVPSNFAGDQGPNSGNAYAGFYSYVESTTNYREVIGIELNQYLTIGAKYFVHFFVCRAFNPTSNWRINIATNKLGARFSTVSFSSFPLIPINNVAHIYADSVINDTLNWTFISGSFIADSAYKYIAVGNFFTDSLTTHISYDSTAVFAYYYVDNVFVSTDSLEDVDYSIIAHEFDFSPNPSNNFIEIKNNRNSIYELSIINSQGQFLKKEIVKEPNLMIDISGFPNGLYILLLRNEKKMFRKKIIKY